MRITGLAMRLVVPGLVMLAAAACQAETPEFGARIEPGQMFSRSRMFNAQNWWTRFGEPVNAGALADGKADVAPTLHGDYVYGPGSCDCPPPCIDQLWAGYYQHPKRCNPYVPLFGRHSCDDCGNCGLGKGCGDGVGCAKAACGCAAPVSCTAAADCGCHKPLCGCKHGHLGHKWKHFMAHWSRDCCDSCAAPIGCGCAAPIAPQVQVPSEKQALSLPQPPPEDAVLIALPRLN